MNKRSLTRIADKKAGKVSGSSFVQTELPILALLQAASESEEAANVLKGHLRLKSDSLSNEWRGFGAIPPGTLLEAICRDFAAHTNIPLEIPFALFFHRLASILGKRGVSVLLGNQRIKMILWMIVLADSSAGKSWTMDQLAAGLIEDADPEVPGIRGVVSAAALFSVIFECPTGAWTANEFGQFVARLERDPRETEMKEYMLLLYDGTELARTSISDGERKTKPTAISVCGLTQHATWNNMIPPRCMLDGFAARFSYLIARPDEMRHFRNYAIWEVEPDRWKPLWENCAKCILPEYRIERDAVELFRSTFHDLGGGDMPESFFRRTMFSAHRLAVCYHLLLNDPSPVLTATDYAWALRLTRMHLSDASEVIGENSMSDLQRLVTKAEAIVAKCTAENRPVKTRDLISGIKDIPNSSTALGLMRIMNLPTHN